jgi:hypothetical protein
VKQDMSTIGCKVVRNMRLNAKKSVRKKGKRAWATCAGSNTGAIQHEVPISKLNLWSSYENEGVTRATRATEMGQNKVSRTAESKPPTAIRQHVPKKIGRRPYRSASACSAKHTQAEALAWVYQQTVRHMLKAKTPSTVRGWRFADNHKFLCERRRSAGLVKRQH